MVEPRDSTLPVCRERGWGGRGWGERGCVRVEGVSGGGERRVEREVRGGDVLIGYVERIRCVLSLFNRVH